MARTEALKVTGNLNGAARLMALGFAFLLVALNLLATAAVAGLAQLGFEPAWNAVFIGVGLLITAFIFYRSGSNRAHVAGRIGKRSATNLSRDIETLRSGVIADATSHTKR